MTNFDYYKEGIERLANNGKEFAIDRYDKAVCSCDNCLCSSCIFDKRGCTTFEKIKWGNEEYDSKKIDWYNLKKDSILKITEDEIAKPFYRCFDHYDKYEEKVYCYPFGMSNKLWELSERNWGFSVYDPSMCELYEAEE